MWENQYVGTDIFYHVSSFMYNLYLCISAHFSSAILLIKTVKGSELKVDQFRDSKRNIDNHSRI